MHPFAHYLTSKRTVDDRALNRRVLERLRAELERVDRPAVADIGAGIGTGIERLIDWGIVDHPQYTAVDRDRELLSVARERLEGRVDAELVDSTLAAFAADGGHQGRFDLVIAHALLDIVDMVPAVKDLLTLVRPGGLLYLPITYDGETIFEPAHEDDGSVLASYHDAMNETGQSRAGRRLFDVLRTERAEILEVGSSDWIVYPEGNTYPHDEQFFLESILGMLEQTLGDSGKAWLSQRRRQLERGQLVYVAHQLDYLARKPS